GRPEAQPTIHRGPERAGFVTLITDDSGVETLSQVPVQYRLGPRTLYAAGDCTPLFTNNETNQQRVFGSGWTNRTPYVKDAFHRTIIDGESCTNPGRV